MSRRGFDFPAFTMEVIDRFYADRRRDDLTHRQRRLWVWVANSWRLRGHELASCVRAANAAVRRGRDIRTSLTRAQLKQRWRHPIPRNSIPARVRAELRFNEWRRRAYDLAREWRVRSEPLSLALDEVGPRDPSRAREGGPGE